MKHPSITRLVVGAPRTLVLGVPVGQRVDASAQAVSAGRWLLRQGQAAAPAHEPKHERRIPRLQWLLVWPMRRPSLAVAGVAGVIVIASATSMLTTSSKPLAPSASPFGSVTTPANVSVVEQAYSSPQESQVLSAASTPPNPPIPGSVALPPKIAATAPAARNVTQPETKPDKPAAVVLDEVATSQVLKGAPAAPLAKTASTQSPAARPPVQANVQPTPSPVAASTPRASGLVAIGPDGKVAVFTNPTTRMPEQFKVGDRLPSGETLKSIDAASGRVVTTAKEYGLE